MKKALIIALLFVLLAQQAFADNPTISNMKIYVDDCPAIGCDDPADKTLLDDVQKDDDGLPIVYSGQYMTFDFDLSYGVEGDYIPGGSILFISRWDWPFPHPAYDYSCWLEPYNGATYPVHTFLPFDPNILDDIAVDSIKLVWEPPYSVHQTKRLPILGEHPEVLNRPPSGRHKIIVGYTESTYDAAASGVLYTYSTEGVPTDVHFENRTADYSYEWAWPANQLDITEVAAVPDSLVVIPPPSGTAAFYCLKDMYQPFDTPEEAYCTADYGLLNADGSPNTVPIWGAIPGTTKYKAALKVWNANPDSEFNGYMRFYTSCMGEAPYSVCPTSETAENVCEGGAPCNRINIPAGEVATVNLEEVCGVPACTLRKVLEGDADGYRGQNYGGIQLYDSTGKVLRNHSIYSASQCATSSWNHTLGVIKFYNPRYEAPPANHFINYVASEEEAAPLKTDKGVYVPGDGGTIYIGWYTRSKGGAPLLPIGAGSKFNVRIYKIDDSDQKIGDPVVEVEKIVETAVTTSDLQNYYISFTYLASDPDDVLSQFVIESQAYEPDGITGIEGGYYKSVPYKVKVLYCAPGDPNCGCTQSIVDITNGFTGKAKRFECSREAPLEIANYKVVVDFGKDYSTASVEYNFLRFVSIDNKGTPDFPGDDEEIADVIGISASQRNVTGNIEMPVIPPENYNKRYAVYLTPDVRADAIAMPSQIVAGIPMTLSALVTNTGFLNIGRGTGSEGIDNLQVKMDYGDGSTPDITSNLTSTTVLATGMSLLADATHAFADVGEYTVTATADPEGGAALSRSGRGLTAMFQAGDAIVEGNEENNVVEGSVAAGPACSTVFCDTSFTESASLGPGCASCGSVPGYVCSDPIALPYVCFTGLTAPTCDGGNQLPGCPLCEACVDNADCESGLCDGGMCVATPSGGPTAALSASQVDEDTINFNYACTDPAKGEGCTETAGCISSCVLDFGDTITPSTPIDFGGDNPLTGAATKTGVEPYTYPQIGTYTATLTTINCSGETATATQVVQIGSNNWPTAEIITPVNGATFNEGAAVTLTGRGSDIEDGFNLTYKWLIDGSEAASGSLNADGTAPAYVASGLSPGVRTITLEVTDQGIAGPPVEPRATGSDSVAIEIIPALGDVSVKSPDYTTINKGTPATFKAVLKNTNTGTKIVNATLSISGPNGYSYACPAQDTTVPGDSGTAEVSCGPVSFDATGPYKFTAKINSCSAMPCNRLASNDSDSDYFTVIQTQAIAVPELPLVFAVLAALAVVAILNRRK